MNVNERVAEAERAHKAGDLVTAVRGYREVLEQHPDHLGAIFLSGIACYQLREYDAAIALLRKIVFAAPHWPTGHYNLGTILQETGQFDEAIRCFRRALKHAPGLAEAWTNLGTSLLASGDTLGAISAFTRAVSHPAPTPEARFNRAFAYLLQGDFRNGFADWEHRWTAPIFRAEYHRDFAVPQWDGHRLNCERLFLWSEQGFGDSLQFLRYWPLVKARAPFVTLELQQPLRRLFAQQGIASVPPGEAPGRFDYHLPSMSLPFTFQTTLETIPPPLGLPGPSVMLDTPSPNVGLVWAGTKKHRNDARRSIPADQLTPLLNVPGVTWHALQVERLDELDSVPSTVILRTYERSIRDFADTAALIRSLDLVITVDTAIAHLAATIGKPTWILLSAWPDWRWMASRDDSPWYPSVKLFRQRRVGDWPEVLERVSHALAHYLNIGSIPNAAVA